MSPRGSSGQRRFEQTERSLRSFRIKVRVRAMSNRAGSPLLRYACAVSSIALATWVRLLLDPVLGNSLPFITMLFAIMVTAWYGGFRPAFAAAVLGGLSTIFFIMPPRGSFAIV